MYCTQQYITLYPTGTVGLYSTLNPPGTVGLYSTLYPPGTVGLYNTPYPPGTVGLYNTLYPPGTVGGVTTPATRTGSARRMCRSANAGSRKGLVQLLLPSPEAGVQVS